jgi:NAD(P)-dependent dehydrogenase (short-subunit alcohol dehydrogenase family)
MSDTEAVIVTGAGGGIGSSTVSRLARAGCSVLAVDIDPGAAAQVAANAPADADVLAHVADVSDSVQVAAMVEAAVARFGRLDGIFNNAGIEGPVRPITRYEDHDFDRVMRINARSTWLGMKHALPALLETKGSILNTASSFGLVGAPQFSGYVASKHAVIGMTRAVALEQAGSGVVCNALCPGPIDTPMLWAIGEQLETGDRATQREALTASVPVGRLGSADEVGALAVWLLTQCPEYLTGAAIPIDGAQST